MTSSSLTTSPRWQPQDLLRHSQQWITAFKKRKGAASEFSPWWGFVFDAKTQLSLWIDALIRGHYSFAPMPQCQFGADTVLMWTYPDRLMIALLHRIIKPTMAHLISPRCYHLKGPQGVGPAIQYVQRALDSGQFTHVMRLDIKGYFRSIDRTILMKQLKQGFNDPRLLHYFQQIVFHAIDKNADVFVPELGIPRRSSLSGFFGALYLSALDEAFENNPNVAYARFMDDIVILTRNARAFRRARKKLFVILKELQLELSPKKTWMGPLHRGFHFLGVQFEAPQSPQSKPQIRTTIHPRSCARALVRVQVMRQDSVHPLAILTYLNRWALWWTKTVEPLSWKRCLQAWVQQTQEHEPLSVWFGQKLLSSLSEHLTPTSSER